MKNRAMVLVSGILALGLAGPAAADSKKMTAKSAGAQSVALDPAAGMPWNYTAAPAQPVLTFTASTQRSGCPSGESAGFRQTGPIRYGHASGLRAQVPD